MKNKLPILIIIPHGGYNIPEELSGYEMLSNFDLFIQADTCANDLFDFKDMVTAKIDTDISRLFVDLDRSFLSLPEIKPDGVIKSKTLYNKEIYKHTIKPDKLALSNIIKRYYTPFHNTIEKIINSGKIKMILECHTVMAVGPKSSPDYGKPRPIISIQNNIESNGKVIKSCSDKVVMGLIENFSKTLAREQGTIVNEFILNKSISHGYILNTYGHGKIPMMKISLSKSLFLSDPYFNGDYLKVDDVRIKQLRDKLWIAIEKFYQKLYY